MSTQPLAWTVKTANEILHPPDTDKTQPEDCSVYRRSGSGYRVAHLVLLPLLTPPKTLRAFFTLFYFNIFIVSNGALWIGEPCMPWHCHIGFRGTFMALPRDKAIAVPWRCHGSHTNVSQACMWSWRTFMAMPWQWTDQEDLPVKVLVRY